MVRVPMLLLLPSGQALVKRAVSEPVAAAIAAGPGAIISVPLPFERKRSFTSVPWGTASDRPLLFLSLSRLKVQHAQ